MCCLIVFYMLWFGFFMLKQQHFRPEADPNVSSNYKKKKRRIKKKRKNADREMKSLARISVFFSNIYGLAAQIEKKENQPNTPTLQWLHPA